MVDVEAAVACTTQITSPLLTLGIASLQLDGNPAISPVLKVYVLLPPVLNSGAVVVLLFLLYK